MLGQGWNISQTEVLFVPVVTWVVALALWALLSVDSHGEWESLPSWHGRLCACNITALCYGIEACLMLCTWELLWPPNPSSDAQCWLDNPATPSGLGLDWSVRRKSRPVNEWPWISQTFSGDLKMKRDLCKNWVHGPSLKPVESQYRKREAGRWVRAFLFQQ